VAVPKEVIVVGSSDVWWTIVQSVDVNCRVIAFSTLDELDRWRENQALDEPSIYPDLVVALKKTGCRLGSLPRRVRWLIETIGQRSNVPALRDLENHWPSRSSFYRDWHQEIKPSPGVFLRRVRVLHARRLLATGRTKKEAALMAGYSSVDQMRRNIRAQQ
jgi:transcriptional regulator GlxA family with amidase domain